MGLAESEPAIKLWERAWPHCDAMVKTSLWCLRPYANSPTYGMGGQPHKGDTRPDS